MAKNRRVKLGSVTKKKDGRFVIKAYIKDKDGNPGSYVLRDGQYINLETKAEQLSDLQNLLKAEKIDADTFKYLKERVEKIPEYVKFEAVVTEEK